MGNESDSSDDGRTSKSQITKLHCHNWSDWRDQFEDVVIAKGFANLFNKEWLKTNKKSEDLKQMTSWAMVKLRATVKRELHPVILNHPKDLFAAVDALATACGEKLVIRLCDKLFALTSNVYTPGSSLAEHANQFMKKYTSLKMSVKAIPHFMYVSTGMAGALLLRSLNQDESLTPLVQSLFDLNPLTFEKVYDRLLIEESRKDSAIAESAYFSNQAKKLGKAPVNRSTFGSSNRGSSSSRGSHRGGNNSRGNFRGLTPTRPNPNNSDNRSDAMSKQFSQLFRREMKNFIESGQADMMEENDDEDYEEEDDHDEDNYVDNPDDVLLGLSLVPIAPSEI
ncbi:hypothetical protein PSTG_11145 [Puccinia striiformis f. sp. tritici PST-78]|uniref:Uncharacterized protein n=1 Tax=Puccinia striiformis f. sp. tritici PST-78 TaxID=1165861 RepID=A0A0L0V8D3_9BASI|nr:hypothetical protein PSTG_11145 [Puccinia striiformis f. sp. tritici PST-78]